MSAFEKDIYYSLLCGGAPNDLSYSDVTAEGGQKSLFWSNCTECVDHFLSSNFIEDRMSEARFFVLADYLTYIPYGKAGLEAFRQILSRSLPGVSVAEYRFAMLEKHLSAAGLKEGDIQCISAGQYEYIRHFFTDYERQEINLRSLIDVVTLFCRFYHECEARLGTESFFNQTAALRATKKFCQTMPALYDERRKLRFDDCIKTFPPMSPLSAEQLDFICLSSGLTA